MSELPRVSDIAGNWNVKGKTRNARILPDGRLSVELSRTVNGRQRWVKGTYDVSPDETYENVDGELVGTDIPEDNSVLLPWHKDFWQAFGSEVGDKKTWKRAGVEMWKTSFGLDLDHLSKEFKGDIDGAEADLDNYSAKEFGIDMAILIGTWGALRGAGAAGKLALTTSVGQKGIRQAVRARSALAALLTGGITRIGRTAAAKLLNTGVKAFKKQLKSMGSKVSEFRRSLVNNQFLHKRVAEDLNEIELHQMTSSLLSANDVLSAEAGSRLSTLEREVANGVRSRRDAVKLYLSEQTDSANSNLAKVKQEYGVMSKEYEIARAHQLERYAMEKKYISSPTEEAQLLAKEGGFKGYDDGVDVLKSTYEPPVARSRTGAALPEEPKLPPAFTEEMDKAADVLNKYEGEIRMHQVMAEEDRSAFPMLINDTEGDLDKQLFYYEQPSSRNIGVWRTQNNDEYYVAFSGAYKTDQKIQAITQGWTGASATGYAPQSREAIRAVEDLIAKNPNAKIHLSGYSRGGGIVNDVMLHVGNNPNVVEGVAIAPNTSQLSRNATRVIANAKGVAKSMDEKMTVLRMEGDVISDSGLPYGKQINLRSKTLSGADSHDIQLWQIGDASYAGAYSGEARPIEKTLTRGITSNKNFTRQDDNVQQEDGTIVFGRNAYSQPNTDQINVTDVRSELQDAASGTTISGTRGGLHYSCTKTNPVVCGFGRNIVQAKAEDSKKTAQVKDHLANGCECAPRAGARRLTSDASCDCKSTNVDEPEPIAKTTNSMSMHGDVAEDDTLPFGNYTREEMWDTMDTYGDDADARVQRAVLGYILYPASQENAYLNQQVVFG